MQQKQDLKNATGVHTSAFAKKIDLVNLKSDVAKLNIDILKKCTKTKYNAKITNIEEKILDTTNLAINTTLNTKINEVKGDIPSIINLVPNAPINAKTK